MIVSACVKFHTVTGKVYEIPCHRHGDAFYIISQFLGASELDKTKTEQGFLDHNDTFLNRYDAMQEAIKCQQVPYYADKIDTELYSEDLW